MDLEEFLTECDNKRKDDPDFDIKSEFKALDSENKTEILTSINEFKLAEVSGDERREKSEFAAQEIYRNLKSLLANNNALKGFEEEALYFKEVELIEGENILLDAAGEEKKINKHGNEYYIDGQKCDISHNSGYMIVEYNAEYNIESLFLERLETSYYQKCAADKTLYIEEAIDLGMIRETADMFIKLTNRKEEVLTRGLNNVIKIFGAFEGKSTLLHLIAKETPPETLIHIIYMTPNPAYLNLPNASGQKVSQIVSEDRAQIINDYLNLHLHLDKNQDPNIERYRQNVHLASVHRSADESFVKLTKMILDAEGIEAVSTSENRVISFDHEKLKDFTDRNINALSKELESLTALTDKELFEKYLKPTLPEFKQEYDQKLVDFTKFQIEKSTALISDAIEHGHVGTNYQSNIDVINSNGLTIREMLAITYVESQDENKLIRAGKPYAKLDLNDKKLCKLEAQMKFIDGLYSIRRGYNIDEGHDNKDTLKFSRDEADKNVCSGGVINRTINSLNSVHSDVEIRVIDSKSVQEKIQQILPDLINEYIAKERQTDEVKLAMELKHWHETNQMSDRLQAEIKKILSPVLDENHEIVQEFAKDFSQSEISGNIARYALENYIYPEGKITKIGVELNSEKNPDILEYYKNNPYTTDEKGNHILTIDYEIQKNPTLIKTLIGRDFKLEGNYVKRDGRMTHIASEYLRYNDDLPEKLAPYMIESPQSFRRVINNSSEDKMHKIISNLVKEGATEKIKSLIKIFPEDNRDEFIEPIQTVIRSLVEKKDARTLSVIVQYFPEDTHIELLKVAVDELVAQNKSKEVDKLLKTFPEEIRDKALEGSMNDKRHYPEKSTKLPAYNRDFIAQSEVGKFKDQASIETPVRQNRGEFREAEPRGNRAMTNPNNRNQGRGV